MKEKKKKTARIVDKSSVSYTFTNSNPSLVRSNNAPDDGKIQRTSKNITRSIVDIKNQNRHKTSSKKIKSLQGHSPVYE